MRHETSSSRSGCGGSNASAPPPIPGPGPRAAHGTAMASPPEIRVGNEPDGRPRVDGEHGTPLPRFAVSIAHTAEVAVAIVRTGRDDRTAVGIDVEQIVARDQATRDFALTAEEDSLLRSLLACAPTTDLPAHKTAETAQDRDGEAL